ncbi:MAG: CesT family type III secretion system chaperone [Deltaproteobacteria bacterium]|nr:CesT family type III secretion system chaperone [Deltaproteobacteria bacterium]
MEKVIVTSSKKEDLVSFLEFNGFTVEILEKDIYRVERDGELPVFINLKDGHIYFEIDLGNVSSVATEKLYHDLLDLNTEILPVAFGLNRANPDDPRLVLVESREAENLDSNELLSVFAALELAVDRAEILLADYLN